MMQDEAERGMTEDELFDRRLLDDPRFPARIAEARATARAGRSVLFEDISFSSSGGRSAPGLDPWGRPGPTPAVDTGLRRYDADVKIEPERA
jgi:hypothetical protein